MADHKRFNLATDIGVYFWDPRTAWQRRSNENNNGLPRRYFPERDGPISTLTRASRPDCTKGRGRRWGSILQLNDLVLVVHRPASPAPLSGLVALALAADAVRKRSLHATEHSHFSRINWREGSIKGLDSAPLSTDDHLQHVQVVQ